MTTRGEQTARLRAMLASYPRLDAETEAALGRMHWRARRAVVLVYGQGMTHRQAARKLGVSRNTVGRDLALAAEVMVQMVQMVQN